MGEKKMPNKGSTWQHFARLFSLFHSLAECGSTGLMTFPKSLASPASSFQKSSLFSVFEWSSAGKIRAPYPYAGREARPLPAPSGKIPALYLRELNIFFPPPPLGSKPFW